MHAPGFEMLTPARAASHELLYVLLSQPHTGATRCGQSSGFFVHFPPASVAPQSGRYAQYEPCAQSPEPRVPHSFPSAMAEPLSPGHAPPCATETPLRAATHAVAYVFPSQPHTGANSIVHMSGMGLHVPAMSPAPQRALGANEQYCLSAQRKPAIPPHILLGAGLVEAAGGGALAEVGGVALVVGGVDGSSGAELLTGGAGGVAVGACAPALGEACDEQPLAAATDRTATLIQYQHR